MCRSSLFAVALLVVFVSHDAVAEDSSVWEERLQTVEKARDLVSAKVEDKQTKLKARAKELYRISRGRTSRSWMLRAQDSNPAMYRAAYRVLRRDVYELTSLKRELNKLRQSFAQLLLDEGRPKTTIVSSLAWPVSRGRLATRFETSGSGAVSAGVEFFARADEPVLAVEKGSVVYVGVLGSLQKVVVLSHGGRGGDFFSILAGFGEIAVSHGQEVAKGEALGRALGDRIYLEVRAPKGSGSTPVDPIPLFARRPRSR